MQAVARVAQSEEAIPFSNQIVGEINSNVSHKIDSVKTNCTKSIESFLKPDDSLIKSNFALDVKHTLQSLVHHCNHVTKPQELAE